MVNWDIIKFINLYVEFIKYKRGSQIRLPLLYDII